MRAYWAVALTFLIGAGGAAPAIADDCGTLKMMASLNLLPSRDRSQMFVPVTMEGKAKLLLVDTGGAFSFITPEAVEELGLSTHSVRLREVGVNGTISHTAVTIANFTLGNLRASDVGFMILPGKTSTGSPDIAGILAPDILHAYDLDIDFAANKLNLMSPDHCEGKVVYWPAITVAMVPMRVDRYWHIVVPVTLDGHLYNAVVDTGASRSTLCQLCAESDFGLMAGGPDMQPVGQLPNGAPVYEHRFKSLSFGDIAIDDPGLEIIPDLISAQLPSAPPTGSRIGDFSEVHGLPDILIGMDILRRLHLYIAYKEQKLYITPAVGPLPQATAGQLPPAAPAPVGPGPH